MLVKSVLSYGSLIWGITAEFRRKTNTIVMKYLSSNPEVSRDNHITNEEIEEGLNAPKIIDRIEQRSLM